MTLVPTVDTTWDMLPPEAQCEFDIQVGPHLPENCQVFLSLKPFSGLIGRSTCFAVVRVTGRDRPEYWDWYPDEMIWRLWKEFGQH